MAPKKRTHKNLNLQEKLDLIKLSEKGMSNAEIGRKLSIPRTTVSSIVHNKNKVLEEIKSATPINTKLIRKHGKLIANMERLLNIWIQDQTRHNVPLSQGIIQAKSLTLFNALKAESAESDDSKFEASRGWFEKFKKRSGLHNIRVQGEAASGDVAAAKKYPDELAKIIENGGYLKEQIFNVDETGLYWKRMPTRTFIAKEEKSMPGFKVSKDRLTLLLGANAAGDCKLKPMLIYHSENPRALKNYSKTSLPVFYKSNKKAWMTGDLFTTWFKDYFKPTVEEYCKKKNIPFKILLLLDNAPSHPTTMNNSFEEIKVLFLPPNTTSILQPMDQGVIATFKSYFLRRTFAKAIEALDADTSTELSVQNKLKVFWRGFNILEGIKTIRDAWAEVKESTLKGVWKKLIPNVIDDFEGFEVSISEVTDNVIEMARQMEIEVDEADVAELLESHDVPLSEEDLLVIDAQRRLYNEEESQPDSDPVHPHSMSAKEIEEGLSLTDKCISYWEKIDPDMERSSRVKISLLNSVTCYKEILNEKKKISMRQTTLTSFFKTQPRSYPSIPSTSVSITPPSPKRARFELQQLMSDDESD